MKTEERLFSMMHEVIDNLISVHKSIVLLGVGIFSTNLILFGILLVEVKN